MNFEASLSYDLFVAPLPTPALSSSSPCGIGVGHLGGEGRGKPGLEGALAGAAGGGGDLGGDLGTVGAHPVGENINGSWGRTLWRLVCTRITNPSSNPSSITSGLYCGYKSMWDFTVPGMYIHALREGDTSIF